MAKGTFYVHFENREAFVDALHARFHAGVEEAVGEATMGLPPGADRIVCGAEAYLDTCLEDRAVKALALEARSDPGLAASMSARHEQLPPPRCRASRRWVGPMPPPHPACSRR